MARYVIVEFDDNDQADAFVRKVNCDPQRKFRVPWVFAKPTKICDCPGYDHQNNSRAAEPYLTVRGEKFGWWVHDVCRRATRGGYQSPHNLLDPEAREMPVTTRRMPGWMFATVHSEDRSYLQAFEIVEGG